MTPRQALPLVFAALLSVPFGPAAARADSKSAMTQSYIYLKQDADLYVGEGSAATKDFAGDMANTLGAAKERALADLASNVRVQVRSDTAEKLESKDGKVSEELKTQSSSHADVALENVQYLELKDFPDPGQATVLASLSKEDYRRQLAGKGAKVYIPQYGLRIGGGTFRSGMAPMFDNSIPASEQKFLNTLSNSSFDSSGAGSTFGLEVLWHGWVAGLDETTYRQSYWKYDAKPGLFGGPYDQDSADIYITVFKVGYDWTPLPWRFQPFVPLRLEYGSWKVDNSDGHTFQTTSGQYSADALGLSAGLGCRYWPSDSIALEFNIAWHQGLPASLTDSSGNAFKTYDGSNPTTSLTGPTAELSILWSSF
jgi:hypothetical protein